jgi:DNA-binding response OmpR family regulator
MAAKKVMVVDDEPFILRSLVYIMKKEGYDVTSAENGEEALAKILQAPPDVLFLDVMMPKKDGFDVCRFLKEDPALAGIHVILLTAKGQSKDRERAVAVGADEYITKPYRPSMVVERVRAILADRVSGSAT